jgi:L-threonylcarbamoyladenylate synthase
LGFGLRYVSAIEAGRLLREGKVGLVPTDTVVGLVAGDIGLARLFEIKGRDPDKPIALLCSSAKEAFALSREASPLARFLADRFWPGPLTLVLDGIGGRTVGVRVPYHPIALAVIAAHDGPLHATSANPTGKPAPKSLEEVAPAIFEVADFVVEGQPGSGEASAVVDLSDGRTRFLRVTETLTEGELARLVRG